MRPKLLDYAKHADDDAVKAASKTAFALLKANKDQDPPIQDAEQALKKLTTLKVSNHAGVMSI